MRERLAQGLINTGSIQFGENFKNKYDSPSCRFDCRLLLSNPELFAYVVSEMQAIIENRSSGMEIVGMATSGIGLAATLGLAMRRPWGYVRKEIERGVSDKYAEGNIPHGSRVNLVDDLVFSGGSLKKGILQLKEAGINVTDALVVVDRQIQRVENGIPLQQIEGLRYHRLITMSEIVHYMVETKQITAEQLANLIRDYQRFERWEMPAFAAIGGDFNARV